MDDWQENLLGNDGLESAKMRGLEGNTTVTLYVKIDYVPDIVGTARLGSAGAANPKGF